MAEGKLVERAADELYGLPPGEFTGAREKRVKELRKDGDREAADAVKALRRPTVAAWALNQLVRRRPKDLERLLAAGEDLRAAQERLLGGGDRSAFQEAAGAERVLVAKLSADATALASEAGRRGSGLEEKVAETLHAAALDEDAAEQLRAGRLVREREAIGGFGAATGGFGAATGGFGVATGGFGAAAAAPARSPAKQPAKPSPRKRQPPSGSSGRAAAADAERRQRLAAARTDERHARRELDAATRAVEHARERAGAAETHAAEAAERARTTAERLKDAKRAETAARKAHSRAASALESAEGGPGRGRRGPTRKS